MKKTHLLAILTTLMISSHVFADEGKKAHQKDHPCNKAQAHKAKKRAEKQEEIKETELK